MNTSARNYDKPFRTIGITHLDDISQQYGYALPHLLLKEGGSRGLLIKPSIQLYQQSPFNTIICKSSRRFERCRFIYFFAKTMRITLDGSLGCGRYNL